MRILLNIPLSPFSGYGNDGLGLARAFMRAGADVYLSPTAVQAPLPEDVALLLTKPLDGSFDIIVQHVDPDSLDASETLRSVGTLLIGWTMWEYSNLKNSAEYDTLHERLELFDAIFCYDQVTADCFREVFEGPLPVLQGGFWPEDWAPVQRDWYSERFGFCVVGALHERKDPFVAIEAFRQLKEERKEEFDGAELHLKTNIPGIHSSIEQMVPKLRVHYTVWSADILHTFYASQHVLISCSRGEGKNMPALEFQSTGGVVIATDWGGHQGWLDERYAYPLDCVLRPVSSDFPNTLNARASIEHLKELMWHTYTHRDEVAEKARLAAEVIPMDRSWDTVVKDFFHIAQTLTPKLRT